MQKRGYEAEDGEVRGIIYVEGPLERPPAPAAAEQDRNKREAGAEKADELPGADNVPSVAKARKEVENQRPEDYDRALELPALPRDFIQYKQAILHNFK